MSNDYADRIAKLKDQKGKLAEKLNTLEQKAKAETRKLDARRKIIVGGAVLAHMEKDAAFAKTIRNLLGASVGRLNDRAAIADLLAATEPALSATPPVVTTPAPSPPPVAPVVAPAAAAVTKPRDAMAQTFERTLGRSNPLDRPVSESSSS